MNRRIWRLALPALGSLAADPLVSLVDTAFVGRLGDVALAALGINAAIFGVVFFLFNFLAYGTTPLVAGAEAEGDFASARRFVSGALLLAGVLGALAVLVVVTAGDLILGLMGTPEIALADAHAYLSIRSLAAPAVLVILVGNGAFRGRQDTATPLRVTLAFNAVNVVLDPLLIFGAGWGLAGAAAATTVAQWIGALWFLRLLAPDWVGVAAARSVVGRLARVGRDLTIRTAALLGTLTLATRVAADAGVNVVAGHQVVSQLWLFTALMLDALAVAAQALVGAEARRPDLVRRLTARLGAWSLALGTLLAAVFWVVLPAIPAWFAVDAATAEQLRDALPLLVAVQPIGALVFIGDGLYIGASRFAFLTWSTVIAGIVAAGYLVIAQPRTLAGVWWGIALLLLVRLASQAIDLARRRGVVVRIVGGPTQSVA